MIEFPRDVDRIAILGDVHGNTAYTLYALDEVHASGINVVVQLGDFGYRFPADFLDALEETCTNHDIILMFVDGNHEDFTWLNTQPVSEDGVRRLTDHIWHLPRGLAWQWRGVTFMAMGGAVSVDQMWRTPYFEWWPEEEITTKDMIKACASGWQFDVMFTHDCPDGVDIPLGDSSWIPKGVLNMAHYHRQVLGDIVDVVRPAHLFHGHYHVKYDGYREKTDTKIYGLHCDGHSIAQTMMYANVKELRRGYEGNN